MVVHDPGPPAPGQARVTPALLKLVGPAGAGRPGPPRLVDALRDERGSPGRNLGVGGGWREGQLVPLPPQLPALLLPLVVGLLNLLLNIFNF